jgi:DNA mismatch repair protein MLH3
VEIETLPPLIIERCRTDPKLLIDLLRDEIWSEHGKPGAVCEEAVDEQGPKQELTWVSEIARCPSLMMEMVKSRACRTAIMFNDRLGMDDCIELVQRLSKCVLPFQCAHGRPTVTVLGEFDESPNDMCVWLDEKDGFGTISGEIGFHAAWDSWIKSG